MVRSLDRLGLLLKMEDGPQMLKRRGGGSMIGIELSQAYEKVECVLGDVMNVNIFIFRPWGFLVHELFHILIIQCIFCCLSVL